MKESLILFLSKYIVPKSKNDDFARREFILNILLVVSMSLIVFGIFLHIVGVAFNFFNPEVYRNNTLSSWIEVVILFFFITLYILSRKGFFRLASYLLLGIFFLFAAYMGYKWGVDVNAGFLLYVLVIVMAGILIDTRFAFFATFIITLTIFYISYLQQHGIIQVNYYWRNGSWTQTDTIMTAVIFLIIATVSWLSNREIEKSLARARRSEAELKKERDSLEAKVEERTAELKKAQMTQISHLYRFAEFGKLSSGLFHDLINPLTAACLNIEQIKNDRIQKVKDMKSYLDKAVVSIKRMENFIIAVKKQIAKEKTESFFSSAEEIRSVVQVLEYKAKKANIEIVFLPAEEIMVYGDPVKFNQVVLNLVVNAIDSYSGTNDISRERKVELRILLEDGIIRLIVRDWGSGIAPEFADKIFQPFFTTKGQDEGTGIGLSLTKRIVENDFGGTIRFKSEKNKGTKFIVAFPIINKNKYARIAKKIQ